MKSGRRCETFVQYKGGCPTRSPFSHQHGVLQQSFLCHNLAQVVRCDGRLIMQFPPVVRGVCAGRQVRTAQTRTKELRRRYTGCSTRGPFAKKGSVELSVTMDTSTDIWTIKYLDLSNAPRSRWPWSASSPAAGACLWPASQHASWQTACYCLVYWRRLYVATAADVVSGTWVATRV